MIRRENSDSLPIDLIHEILPRLPAKSIARFRCVSKLWRSMLSRQYFTELFLTRSRARPRFLFACVRACEWSFYSSPQPQNPAYVKSSLVLSANFHMKFHENMWPQFRSLTSGLIYFSDMRISEKDKDTLPVLYNPSTRRLAILPKVRRYINTSYDFLVFDPIDKQFKVLSICYPHSDDGHRILTLGTGKIMWREIQCPLNHYPCCQGICINGVLYYIAQDIDETFVIVVFDVRSEKFNFIHVKCISDQSMFKLINYKGKLGWISLNHDYAGGRLIDLCVWVLEDVEKHEYTKHVYTFPENDIVKDVFVVGMTASGEIVLAMEYTRKPFYVFYFDPERNTLQSVEIQGLGENLGRVYAFVDHVEDLNVNDAKFLNSIQFQNSIRNLCNSLPKKQPAILLQNKYDSLANLE